MYKIIAATILLLLSGCLESKTGIPVEQYVDFRAECMLIQEAYSHNPIQKNRLLAYTMQKHEIDSVKLQHFLSAYRDDSEKWLEVEKKVEARLLTMLKESEEKKEKPAVKDD